MPFSKLSLGCDRSSSNYSPSSLGSGIKLTLSALLDGKNINAGGHKLGLGLEFEA